MTAVIVPTTVNQEVAKKAFSANEGGWAIVITLIEEHLAKNP